MLCFYLGMLETQDEKDTFTLLYRQYAKLMKHVAYEKLGDDQLAEDAVHNAFLNIIKSFCKIEEINCHKTKRLLVIVTENAATDMLRKDRRIPQVEYVEAAQHLSVTPDMLEGIAARELEQIIADLPGIYRDVLELRVYHGLNEKQIAAVLNVNGATVRKRLERARGMLAGAIKKQQEGATV